MEFSYKNIVPWGRSFNEYIAMFALSEECLCKKILGCGDGPAAFNVGITKRGGEVISVDPLYQFTVDEIKRRIDETYDEVITQTLQNADKFVWKRIKSIDELGAVRMAAMNEFMVDYPAGLNDGRYINASLPHLPFQDKEFELALCSHFLFLYSEHLSLNFHIQSIIELCRVANEVRIFPLLDLGIKKSRHLDAVILRLKEKGVAVETINVPYEFQKGGNQMLKLS